jgi:hypothetical protein
VCVYVCMYKLTPSLYASTRYAHKLSLYSSDIYIYTHTHTCMYMSTSSTRIQIQHLRKHVATVLKYVYMYTFEHVTVTSIQALRLLGKPS